MGNVNSHHFDALVIGSGISGGWAAKELCQQGLKTLMLERGPNVVHRQDYPGEGKAPWEMHLRGKVASDLTTHQYSIQKDCYAFNDATRQFFANDRDIPYSQSQDKPFSWIRGNQLGGRSLLWHRQSYRWSDLDFGANAKDGHGVDWPIRYKDIEPWYDHVERFIGVSGQAENLPQLPDGQFQPPMEMNCVETVMKGRIEKAFPGRIMTIGRTAHLTEPTQEQKELGRQRCQSRNECQRGCSFGAYFSTQSATLPAAQATGNLTVATDTIVHSVIYDARSNRATGVRVVDAVTKETSEYFGKVVFLCASTLGTTQVLLNSVSPDFPDGLANTSGQVGRNLMDHCFQAGAKGRFPGMEDKYYRGRRPNGIYIPRFRNVTDQHPDFLRGYGYQGGAARKGWKPMGEQAGFGTSFKNGLRQPGPWMMDLGGFGEMLPQENNTVKLNPELLDAWGMPTLHIDCAYGDNEKRMLKDMAETAAEMLETTGVVDIETYNKDVPPGLCIHEMGTARMGKDPRSSVLNGNNQAHDISNLFITDGSCMASTACQNPSLTYMALTARAAHYAVEQLKQGAI
ncbi:MAG: GMC family oxidoreductase [Halieaceae bacterium]|jgi:choline dehydrogenase-like flavoprotein|nr:GMC family oxidoreductase [Halieaceae bacterium]